MTDRIDSHQSTERAQERNGRDGLTRGLKRRLASPSWLARGAAAGLSGVSVGFVGLVLFVLETGGELTLITRPGPMQFALVLPYAIAALALATAAGALLAWWRRYWSLLVRIHQTTLALLGLGFSWQLAELGFLMV